MSVRRRIVLATAIITTIGMGMLVALLAIVLDAVVDDEIDGALRDRSAAVIATVEPDGGSLLVRETPDAALDKLAWIYDSSGSLKEGPETSGPLTGTADSLGTVEQTTVVEIDDWRLRAEPIVLDGTRLGTVVVGVALVPYRTTVGYAIAGSAGLGLLVSLGMSLLAAWTVGRALAPVAVMARRAEEWSEDELDKRFELGDGGDEITQLGRVLDRLLERVSRTILAEQRLTAELAHELRTPLTVIRAEAELAGADKRMGAQGHKRFERIAVSAEQMSDSITTLLSLARGSFLQEDAVAVERVFEQLSALPMNLNRRCELVFDPGGTLFFAVPENVAIRALSPVLENALRYATSRIDVTARPNGENIEVRIVDDGAGISVDPAQLFAPGYRDPGSPGAGLGLSLARRLARAAGGDVELIAEADETAFVIILPRATRRRGELPAATSS
ncbi:sensor histidine kinase [Luethyella okanaganae]|uniref:histidine kinase n=1 Tax=Luethyella okanaganae TaxID=69372 RepID=A0ABW1VGA2_9MICO